MMRFGRITPTLVIEREEMPRARLFNLIVDHVPDDRKAGEAIEMIALRSLEAPRVGVGRFGLPFGGKR
jgi:hypothetical protein